MAIRYEKVSDKEMKEVQDSETSYLRPELEHQKAVLENKLARINELLAEMDKLGVTKTINLVQ